MSLQDISDDHSPKTSLSVDCHAFLGKIVEGFSVVFSVVWILEISFLYWMPPQLREPSLTVLFITHHYQSIKDLQYIIKLE